MQKHFAFLTAYIFSGGLQNNILQTDSFMSSLFSMIIYPSLWRKKCRIWFCTLSPQYIPAQSAICVFNLNFFNFYFAEYFTLSWFAVSILKFSISILQNVSLDPDLRFQFSNFHFYFAECFAWSSSQLYSAWLLANVKSPSRTSEWYWIVNYLSHYKRNIWLQNCPNTFNFCER